MLRDKLVDCYSSLLFQNGFLFFGLLFDWERYRSDSHEHQSQTSLVNPLSCPVRLLRIGLWNQTKFKNVIESCHTFLMDSI